PTGSLFAPAEEEKKGKKKEIIIRDRKAEIQQQITSINSAYKGQAVLRQGADITNVFLLRRPTGLTSLDLKLAGGLPAGGFTQIIGRFSSGKTYMANRIMATAQQNYDEEFAAFIAMTEMRFDKGYAKTRCALRIAYSEEEIALLRHIQVVQKGLPDFPPETYA